MDPKSVYLSQKVVYNMSAEGGGSTCVNQLLYDPSPGCRPKYRYRPKFPLLRFIWFERAEEANLVLLDINFNANKTV
jgi:hypothetical protein